jgi:uncharacterized membrane protein (UPF0182 family)
MADQPVIPPVLGAIAVNEGVVLDKPSPKVVSGVKRSSNRHLLRIAGASAVIVLIVLAALIGIVQKWLWMGELGFRGIFWTLLRTQWAMFGAAFLVAFFYLWINVRHAGNQDQAALPAGARGTRRAASSGAPQVLRSLMELSPRLLSMVAVVSSAAIALLFAISFYARWDTYLRFRHGESVGVVDPLFGIDVGFYLFRLPFYTLVQNSLMVLTAVTLVIVLLMYMVSGLLQLSNNKKIEIRGGATAHISVLLAIVVADAGFGFYLDHYELVYSTLGIVYGAGYAADHVTRVSLWFMVAMSISACVLLAFNVIRRQFSPLLIGSAIYAMLYLVAVQLLPVAIQKFLVQPNELALESPYLKHYIDFTRKAYQLDAVQEIAYPALPDLTAAVVARNEDTIQNIRLWDARPLLQTYAQTQAIRLYYQFYNVAVDRYHLADGYHQVMLSTRELAQELPEQAQTWVNQRLQFTHGYGLVMSFVSKTVGGGFPDYLLQNVPAESAFGLSIEQPAIYYGESAVGYRIVSTSIKEFDYPKGNDNVYTSYSGTGGIPVDGFWKKLLFAWTQGDINILLTSYITSDSRIQIWRRAEERVAQIAPFLQLDSDPYPVLSHGRLYWIQDAYTVSDRYPYSNPRQMGDAGTLNYIRNSVKIVVDMYDGSVQFYLMDTNDPVLAVYRKAFPGVFKDLSQLSPELKAHLRYPEDQFAIQADAYKTFHMTDPQVFYNREDLWVSPNETYDGKSAPMDPYYILMKLPGSDQLEYLLMTPFTPQKRDNMISWLAARCDFPDYGKMMFYQLPKEKLVYGPSQIEAMINQNTTISQQLTLWDQRGSGVIRGKLIVTPIENSFLYIVPLYLQAEGANFPQLKRVIAVAGDKVVMEPTLDAAVSGLFGTAAPAAGSAAPAASATLQPSLERARMMLEEAQKAMQQGDWTKFGTSMQGLELQLGASPVH